MSAKLSLLTGLGASVGGVGVWGIYKLTNPKNEVKTFTDEEYQLIFKKFKSESTFITSLQTKIPTITNSSTNIEGGKATKAWCVGNDSLNAKKWCIQLPKTIREKINKSLVTDWAAKVKSIKDTDKPNLLNDLKTIKSDLSAVSEDENSRNALKGWCESKLDTRLINDDGDAIYTKVEARCLEK
ncbi:hypothetical protein MHC_00870 [Mycoplasma haemocanis str. Illinois]|uniref:Uncharacterized protein n=1 Tax=Mycoplasma haemocanis (strain Illinois) TaxID=1111676 RepID=H6N5T0_MYCHN|nr:hypothetical protein [Mycoplasma haemocanis]AEW45040.1 hypothetical protein MHC_00870 [Mycoplasma haemocanis str. Illinois]